MKWEIYPEDDAKRTEIYNLPDRELKIIIIKILTKVRRAINENGEKFNNRNLLKKT